jgi:hypothetical protein
VIWVPREFRGKGPVGNFLSYLIELPAHCGDDCTSELARLVSEPGLQALAALHFVCKRMVSL